MIISLLKKLPWVLNSFKLYMHMRLYVSEGKKKEEKMEI